MQIGQTWNGWTIKKYLGEGSFGKVYKIVREEFGYQYESALKVIRIPQNPGQLAQVKNEGMTDEEVRSYFYSVVQSITSEFALMSELSGNSNIVSYEDHSVTELEDEFGWDIFLRMELAVPLYEHLHGETLTERDIVEIGIDISSALEICQKNKVIHRDIKPDNIFYSKQSAYKLGDFGIARKLEKVDSGMTKVGTFSYMAPEVYKGSNYDSTADIYSLGIILYQFLNNNRRPFLPSFPEQILFSDNEKANLKRMTGEKMPQPASASDALSAVILKACAYDPKDRYQSAQDMTADLKKILPEADNEKVVFPFEGANKDELKVTENNDPYLDETVTMFSSNVFSGAHLEKAVSLEDESDDEAAFDEVNGSERAGAASTESGRAGAAARENERAGMPEGEQEEKSSSHEQENTGEHRSKIVKIISVLAAVIVICCGLSLYSYFNHEVPELTGLTHDKAESAAVDAGLVYEETGREFSDSEPAGTVLSQSPDEGSRVKKGTHIAVVISRGKAIKAPDLTGMQYDEAEKKAEKLGLKLAKDEKTPAEYSDKIEKGCIIRQDIKKGTLLEEGATVKVVRSKGKEQVKVPGLAGLTRAQAEEKLKTKGFSLYVESQYSSSVARGIIISQYPSAGQKVDKGSSVTTYVSLGRAPVTKKSQSSGSSTKKKSSGSTKHAKGKKL